MLQQPTAIGSVDGHVHGPEIVDGEEREQHLGRVRLPSQHMLSAAYALGLQAHCRRHHAFAQLRIGKRDATIEHGIDLLATLSGPAFDEIAHHADFAGRDARIEVGSGNRGSHGSLREAPTAANAAAVQESYRRC